MNAQGSAVGATLPAPTTPDTQRADVAKVASSSAFLLLENLVRIAASALGSLWVARALGPGAFGELSFAMALMALCLVPAALGLELPLLLRLASGQRVGATLGTALALRLGAAFVAFALAVAVAFGFRASQGQSLEATLIVALSIIGYAPAVFDVWFRAVVEPRVASLARVATTLVSLGAKVWVLSAGGGLVGIAWTVVFESVLYSLTIFLAWRRAARVRVTDSMHPDRSIAIALWKQGSPYLLAGIVTILYMKADVLILGALSSSEQTGLYSLAQKLAEVLTVVPLVLLDSALPMIVRRSQLSEADGTASGQILFDLAGAMAWLTVGAAMLMTPLVSALFGAGFARAAPLFELLAWTGLSVALGAARQRWLAVKGLQSYAVWLALQGALVNGVLNACLVPTWGAQGAAVSALITSAVAGVGSSFMFGALRPIGRMQCRALWPWVRLWRSARVARHARRVLP